MLDKNCGRSGIHSNDVRNHYKNHTNYSLIHNAEYDCSYDVSPVSCQKMPHSDRISNDSSMKARRHLIKIKINHHFQQQPHPWLGPSPCPILLGLLKASPKIPAIKNPSRRARGTKRPFPLKTTAVPATKTNNTNNKPPIRYLLLPVSEHRPHGHPYSAVPRNP